MVPTFSPGTVLNIQELLRSVIQVKTTSNDKGKVPEHVHFWGVERYRYCPSLSINLKVYIYSRKVSVKFWSSQSGFHFWADFRTLIQIFWSAACDRGSIMLPFKWSDNFIKQYLCLVFCLYFWDSAFVMLNANQTNKTLRTFLFYFRSPK